VINAKHVTDRAILEIIHSRYYAAFKAHSNLKKVRSTKIYVPIDCEEIGKQLGTDPQIIFGRLYYHLDYQYRYQMPDGAWVNLFSFKVGDDKHCVNFPYLDGILAGYTDDKNRFDKSFWISIVAILISTAALLLK